MPEGTAIELRAPVFKQYGEELDFVLTEIRKKGCRKLIIDGKTVDISEQVELDEAKVKHMDAIVDRLVVGRGHEKAIQAGIAATLLVGAGLMQVQVVKGASKAESEKFYKALTSHASPRVRRHPPDYFMFNNPEARAARAAASGFKLTHPELLLPDPSRSIRAGCFEGGVPVQRTRGTAS